MENATKALLIAGGLFILLAILSIGVFLHSQLSNQTKEYKEIISSNEVRKFNSNFDVYIGRNNISPQEVVTVVNLANKYNGQVSIEIVGISLPDPWNSESFIIDFIDKTFTCTDSQYDNNTGKIKKLKFQQNSLE